MKQDKNKWNKMQHKSMLKFQENQRKKNLELQRKGLLFPKVAYDEMKRLGMLEKKPRKKRKQKTEKQKKIKKLDDKWSLEVRKHCKCELCGREGDIGSFDAHHIKKRSNMATRWYIPNGACLCRGCHRFKVHMDTFTVAELILKLQKKRGSDWYPELVKRANSIFKPQQVDFDEILKGLLELQNK